LAAYFALQNTKFGNEKGKVQKPARIPPQTPPAGGTEAEAGQFPFPQKNSLSCRVQISFQDFRQKMFEFRSKGTANHHFLNFGRNFGQGLPRPCGARHCISKGFSKDF